MVWKGNVGAENFQPLRDKEIGFDFDFNILTAFIRLGRARPVRGGVPSLLLFYLNLTLFAA
jgi:hypothetical protein